MESAFARSLSATTEMRIARPARRWISSAFRFSTSHVPPPTMPIPSRPTLMGFISLKAQAKMVLDVRPFGQKHAVHHGIAYAAVATRPVVADDAVLLRAERLDRALRAEIEVVGAQAHHFASQFFEAVLEEKQLARGVHVRALAARRVPGPADLDAVGRRDDVVVARRSDDGAGLQVAHRPGQELAFLLPVEGGVDVGAGLFRLGDAGEEKLPEPAVLRRCDERLLVVSR